MRINEPVTDHEVKLVNGQELVTKTDLNGVLTFINLAFIEISGFSNDELMGQNHNIVRHPDMPTQAFKDLWSTLKLGRPWSKLVKNRCKNGDYYWVKAHVTPVFRNGEMVEYMSVRTRPTEAEIEASSKLYAQLRKEEVILAEPESVPEQNLSKGLSKNAATALVSAVVINAALYLLGLPDVALMAGPIAAFAILFIGAQNFIKSNVISQLKQVREHLQEVSSGKYLADIPVDEPGELGGIKREIKMLGIKLGFEINDTKQQMVRSQRIKVALDKVSSNIMLADARGEIIYANDAVIQMMRVAQEDVREQLPNFDAEALVGSNYDIFHKNPAHQQNMLESLKTQFNGSIKVGIRTFKLIANPVVDDANVRLGTVVEWADTTDQLNAEQAVEDLIVGATRGELEKRLDTELYTGFMKSIATGVNQMLDAVVGPLQEVKRVLESVAEGDMTESMEGEFHGEFQELNSALNLSIGNLSNMINEIRTTGSSITTGASEISTGNATLSQRTESQAASLEETAASMEEMTSTVKQNAENAEEARNLAANAQTMAEKGGEISTRVVTSMGDISDSSSKIAEIIGVIDEIAFQTNLLALNAAVEAARAGEQGRGFAVVASEVRSLAQRSAGAAKEIKELINDSVKKVEEGSGYVKESGQALSEIMDSISNVTNIVSEIASASREQASGIEQVNVAVTQMDEGTQQNAALVEEVAAASSSLDEQAAQLQRLVSVFNVNEDEVQVAPVSTAKATPDVQKIRKMAAQQSAKPKKAGKKKNATKARAIQEAPIVGADSSAEEWNEF